jgi:hypothetical protein
MAEKMKRTVISHSKYKSLLNKNEQEHVFEEVKNIWLIIRKKNSIDYQKLE